MRTLLAALALLVAAPLSADFADFSPRRPLLSLFVQDDEARVARQPRAEEPPRAADADPDGNRHDHAGRVGLAFWATPFLRFTEDPTGVGVGFGFEFSHMASEQFGSMVSMSIWSVTTSVVDGGDEERVDVACFDIELGPRFHALNWRGGRMYMDLRLMISFCDGPSPVRSTVALGGTMRWGFEFGNEDIRTFLEAGMGWRSAINHGDAGWLEYEVSNGSGGMFFDLLRVGMRLYF